MKAIGATSSEVIYFIQFEISINFIIMNPFLSLYASTRVDNQDLFENSALGW
jgi:hypothetical protein